MDWMGLGSLTARVRACTTCCWMAVELTAGLPLVMYTLPHSIGPLLLEDFEGCPPLDMGRDIGVFAMVRLF